MKSKTLSFDKTLFFKNIKRFWPIWAGYLFVMIWAVPAVIYFNSLFRFGDFNIEEHIISTILDECLDTGRFMSVVIGLLAGMAVFSYLDKENSCNFYHSLPFNRVSLFITNYISGLVMIFIPNLIITVMGIIVSSNRGYAAVGPMFLWLLIVSVCSLFFYSFAIICSMLTGQLLVVPILFMIFNLYVRGMIDPINAIINYQYIGIERNLLHVPSGGFGILSPFSYMYNIYYSTGTEGLQNVPSVLITLTVTAIIFTVLSIIIYKHRKSERAGDTIAIDILRPVFRWGVGISFGSLVTAILLEWIFSSYDGKTTIRVITLVLLVTLSVVGYLIAQMIMKKSFRVIKGICKELAVFTGIVLGLSILLAVDCFGVVNRVPDADEVSNIHIYYEGQCHFDKQEAIEEIIELHKLIIDNKYQLKSTKVYDNENYDRLSISYTLKNGKEIYRYYAIPLKLSEVQSKLDALIYKHPYTFVFDDIYLPSMETLRITAQMPGSVNTFCEYQVLDKSAQARIINAIMQDIDEGNLGIKEAAGFHYYKDDNTEFEYTMRSRYYYNPIDKYEDAAVEESIIINPMGSKEWNEEYAEYDEFITYGYPYVLYYSYYMNDNEYPYTNYVYYNKESVNTIRVVRDLIEEGLAIY